jgi:hypothetical protein
MPCLKTLPLLLSFTAVCWCQVGREGDPRWRISPQGINIQVGEDRPLQALDDSAQELRGTWSVNNPNVAEIREENGRIVLRPTAAGTVRVTATVGGETRFRDINIWPDDTPLPVGTSRWELPRIGREIGDLAAVPTGDGPELFFVEQTASGNTYVRGVTDKGVQIWAWLMPETTPNVELVCGDFLGGALISANHGTSYTLYTVGKDGRLRWQHTLDGIRKGHAYNQEHLIHLLSQSPDRTVTRVTGLDEVTGVQKFDLIIPPSHEKQLNIRKWGALLLCAAQSSTHLVDTGTSSLFVNIDGFAYLAFMQQDWELAAPKCTPGGVIKPAAVNQTRMQHVILWQIHPDGTVRSTLVEESQSNKPFTEGLTVVQPTGSIIPDGLGGVLLSVGWAAIDPQTKPRRLDEFVYRLDPDGNILYKLLLPRYDGQLRDEWYSGKTVAALPRVAAFSSPLTSQTVARCGGGTRTNRESRSSRPWRTEVAWCRPRPPWSR